MDDQPYNDEWSIDDICVVDELGSISSGVFKILAFHGDDVWLINLDTNQYKLSGLKNLRPVTDKDIAVNDMLLLDPYNPDFKCGTMSRRDFCQTLYENGYRKIIEDDDSHDS